MHVSATVPLPASPERIFALLVNPQSASACVPGLNRWQPLELPNHFRLWLDWRAHLPASTFRAQIADGPDWNQASAGVPILLVWETVTPPSHLAISAQVEWRDTAVPLNGVVDLTPTGPATTDLTFRLDLHTTNKLLMQMAANIIPKTADAFFTCLSKQLKR